MHGQQTIVRLNAAQQAEVDRLTSPQAIQEAERISAERLNNGWKTYAAQKSMQARVDDYIGRLREHDFSLPLPADLVAEQVAIDPTMEIMDRHRPAQVY